jgi:hypothetical protein
VPWQCEAHASHTAGRALREDTSAGPQQSTYSLLSILRRGSLRQQEGLGGFLFAVGGSRAFDGHV